MPLLVKVFIKIISIIIALGLFIAAGAFGIIIYYNSPPQTPNAITVDDNALRLEDSSTLFLEVRNGESARSVGARLEAAGIIRSQFFWQLLSRIKNEHIKTGTYLISLPKSQMEIHSFLVLGEQLLIRVTIPEGVTLKKTANLLEEAGICSAEDFLAAASSQTLLYQYNIPGRTMEGYLFPDTYLFPLAYPAERVVMAMADNFFRRLSELVPQNYLYTLSREELNDHIIMASIVEREYRIADEAALMAGVFYNRLRINMMLQSCATVEYIITEIQGLPHPRVLYNRDLEIRDPYNTYQRTGLPPGPISAPGAVSLLAAFFPTPSNYFYFRLTDANAGRHYFSQTFDEHIQAGALYLKGN